MNPCPFCGGTSLRSTVSNTHSSDMAHTECTTCWAIGPGVALAPPEYLWEDADAEAMRLWDKRSDKATEPTDPAPLSEN